MKSRIKASTFDKQIYSKFFYAASESSALTRNVGTVQFGSGDGVVSQATGGGVGGRQD